MKRKYPEFSLNKAPTLKDLEFGSIAAEIARDHWACCHQNKYYSGILSERIAKALKDFRCKNRKKK